MPRLPLRTILAVVFVCASPGGAASQDTSVASGNPAARLFARLVSPADSTQAYALFLPAGYTAARRWPIVFALDPRGRALVPLERLRAAADERGYVVMSSYNSLSDGPFEPNLVAMNSMLADAQRTLSIDERRLYIAGFSGTARAAWLFARELGEHVPGIIGTGAGIDRSFFRDDSARRRTLAFYGAIGRHDFNYEEMRELDARLDTLGLRHRVTYFAGRHDDWPADSVLAAGLEWLDLSAMRRGLRPYDSTWVDRMASRDLAAARALEASGLIADALEAYQDVARDYEHLPQGREAADRAAAVGGRPDLKLILAERAQLAHASERYRATLDLAMGPLNSGRARPDARDLVRLLKIDSLKREAGMNRGERSDAARRLLEFAFVVTSFYQPRHFIERGDAEGALIALEVAAMIDAESPRLCLYRAHAWGLRGRVAEAVRELECARRGGARADLSLAHRAFDRIRETPAFRAFADSYGGRQYVPPGHNP